MHESVIYSGFLATSVTNRKMHYVFVQANMTEPKNAPLAIWLNGGPGCSSLMGMLRQVGPYIVGNDYKQGDLLTKNDYAWSNAAHMLFLQSPSIVGFSTESDSHYHWTDEQTAKDLLYAIKDFLFHKAPQYSNSSLFITGQSYAGKYIPDVSVLIFENNIDSKEQIHLKGIMVGNGVMDFTDNSLDISQTQYLLNHDMVSNRIQYIYRHSCDHDYKSPRCKFSKYQIGVFEAYTNPYNIYQTCTRGNAQSNRLKEYLRGKQSARTQKHIKKQTLEEFQEIPTCPSDMGGINYWNLNKVAFHVENITKTWSVCSHLNYSISQRGSMQQYRQLLLTGALRIWLYNGDFDDVVPYVDTQKNVQKLNRLKSGDWTSWNVGDQHAGFYQVYQPNFTVITVKAAGHMVPQNQPKPSYQLFYNFVNGKGVNNQIF